MEIERFEGQDVTEFEVKFPAMTVDTDQPYRRGSIVRLAVEARIGAVGFREDKDGRLIRTHTLRLTDINVVSTFDPAQDTSTVGGSLAGGAVEVEVDDEELAALGIDPNRTGDLWPPTAEALAEAVR